jgi:uncharacterized protein YjbI with pentapeptide repeats
LSSRPGTSRSSAVRSVLLVVTLGCIAAPAPASASASKVGSCVIRAYTSCPSADLRSADLSGADLRNANLQHADLRHANLRGANLTSAKLGYAKLDGADASSATLTGANLAYASFHGGNLQGARLDHVAAIETNLSSVLMQHASAREASFSKASLDGSQLDGADLTGASLVRSSSARATNFAGATLHGTSLQNLDARGANFHGAHLKLAYFRYANVEHATFGHAHFEKTDMLWARASGATFYPSNFDSDDGPDGAVQGIYERVRAHLNGAGDGVGFCGGRSDHSAISSDDPHGYCTATAVHGGSHGFFHSTPRASGWTWQVDHGVRHVTVHGTDNVELSGTVSSNWGAFYVTSVRGILTGHTGHRAVGHPGGPLAVNLEKKIYHQNLVVRQSGYVMVIHGWLPRKPCEAHPGLCG